MAKARLNSSELARLTGLPATTIKRIRNNEQANPTIATLLPIANHFSLTMNELLGMDQSQANDFSLKTGGLKRIPLLSWQECAYYDSLDFAKQPKSIITERKLSDKAYSLLVESSDLQIFPKDSLIIIEPKISLTSGDYIVVTHRKSIASIKKYIIETDKIYLKSLIPGIDISELTTEHKILGVIVQYKVELKLETQ
jgi:SOS-response transcriptional repressor LexA